MKFCFELFDFTETREAAEKPAVIDHHRELSWAQFRDETERLCSLIRHQGWTRHAGPVIVYGHKQAEMIVTIYALMKLRITYIPVDKIYPRQRIDSIRKMTGSEIVYNCSGTPLNLENTTEVMVFPEGPEIHSAHPVPEKPAAPDPLVYIIFTSGSSGAPKGVQISTSAIRSFAGWMTTDFGFGARDVFINTAVFSFDLSVYELITFAALGATLLINEQTTPGDTETLLNRIGRYQGTIWVSTPSFTLAFTRAGADSRLDSLRYFLYCGEVLPHTLARYLADTFPRAVILNTYGPTEATVATTRIEITPRILELYDPLPVGPPRPGSEILIDKQNPEDQTGEIIIVGDHVSVGYFNNDALNVQKFFFVQGKRAYRTGDLGYFRDGYLFCAGRNDDQVKMHGFRIELNEISSVIRKNKHVMDAVTVGLRRNGQVKKLVSFVILKAGIRPEDFLPQIREALHKALPFYMIPGDIDIVDRFPTSTNFKIDRNSLINDYLKKHLG